MNEMKFTTNWIQYGGILIKHKLLSSFTVKTGHSMDIYIYREREREQSNESEISPIKPASVTRIQAWIRRVFRNNDYVK